jgi:hypothetical protein
VEKNIDLYKNCYIGHHVTTVSILCEPHNQEHFFFYVRVLREFLYILFTHEARALIAYIGGGVLQGLKPALLELISKNRIQG